MGKFEDGAVSACCDPRGSTVAALQRFDEEDSMPTRSIAPLLLPALFLAGCDRSTDPGEGEHLETREVTVGPTLAKRYAYRLLEQLEKTPAPSTPATLSVGPARVICYRSDDFCMVVDGVPYDDMITSFEYEAGYHYVLEASRYSDGRYVLNEVSSRTEVSGAEEEITVDAHRVECGDGYPGYCKVVNGAPFRGQIVGFQPLHDYNYRLLVERFGMFPDGTTGSPVPAHGYRWLETLESTLKE